MPDRILNSNPLISTKSSDSDLTVALHPLVLLTVSDHITRHRVRNETGPIIGALLGQQKGRETTIEHAFQCKSIPNSAGEILLDQAWFEDRLQQYKDVHKVPALDFVGWFTLCPEDGPISALVPLHKQIMLNYNESPLLLAFHPSAISSNNTSTGKLPLTIYESIIESDPKRGDGSMQIDDEDAIPVKFRPVMYAIETDETEMIAIDYVAKGAGSAAAVHAVGEGQPLSEEIDQTETKGKQRADPSEGDKTPNETKDAKYLSTEEEDLIAGMTTRLNSVRMLQSRLALLSRFIRSQSPSYLSDPNAPLSKTSPDPSQLPHLRNVQALLTRLSLLTPSLETAGQEGLSSRTEDPFSSASLSQSNDVGLSFLLSLLGQDLQGMGEMGRKFAAVEQARMAKSKSKPGPGGASFGGMGDFDVSMSGASMLV